MRKRQSSSFVSVMLVLIVAGSLIQFASAAGPELVSASTDVRLEQLMIEGNIPSLHVCIVSEDSINWVRGFGEETNVETPFLIGSIQKVFVAISVMQLFEKGEIELDTDVSEYLPFDLINPMHPNITITPRLLLAHRSGLGIYLPYEFCYDWNGEPFSDYTIGYSTSVINITLAEYLSDCLVIGGQHYSNENWLSWEPGTEYSYANSGFKLLMCLLETVTGQSISDYMQENIFTSLRLNNTGFNATALDTPQATPYTRNDITNTALPVWNGEYMIRSSISDMGNLLIALMNMGEFDGQQLLQPETIEMMMENTYSDVSTWDLRKEPKWKGYGLGLDMFSHELHGHGGSTIGFTADCHFNPTLKKGFVRLSNVNSILDPTGEEWRDIYAVTNEVKTIVLAEVGMIPPIGILEVSLILMPCGCAVAIISTIIRKRRATNNTQPELIE